MQNNRISELKLGEIQTIEDLKTKTTVHLQPNQAALVFYTPPSSIAESSVPSLNIMVVDAKSLYAIPKAYIYFVNASFSYNLHLAVYLANSSQLLEHSLDSELQKLADKDIKLFGIDQSYKILESTPKNTSVEIYFDDRNQLAHHKLPSSTPVTKNMLGVISDFFSKLPSPHKSASKLAEEATSLLQKR